MLDRKKRNEPNGRIGNSTYTVMTPGGFSKRSQWQDGQAFVFGIALDPITKRSR